MKTVRLYWSNVCILHKHEHQFLDDLTKKCEQQGINLEVTYFGIGCPKHLNEYLLEEDAILPDILVSTDLEVFENENIFNKFDNKMIDLTKYYAIKEEIKQSSIYQNNYQLPFLVIPLVFSYNNQCKKPTSLKDTITNKQPTTIGGINNSGAKCVIKAIWAKYGKEAAIQFLDQTTIQNMPIQAFHEVRMGSNKLAITPLVYAKQANNQNLFVTMPSEGAIALPSYITCFNTIDHDSMRFILDALLDPSFCNYFVEYASLYSCIKHTSDDPYLQQNNFKFLYPSNNWFKQTSSDEFYQLYNQYI